MAEGQTTGTTTRVLGRSGIEVSAVGLGCWAIGGPLWSDDEPRGWGQVDDDESVRAVNRAVDLGVTLFDTADVYGAGHSERILGRALGKRRDEVAIATKFGVTFDEGSRRITGTDASPDHVRRACDASLERLGTDRIDLYQFHTATYETDLAPEVREVLEELVAAGKIRAYGWSTDDAERIGVFAEGPGCAAAQIAFNVLGGSTDALERCERKRLAALIRGPLGMGLLTGKFSSSTSLPDDDVRHGWDFSAGDVADRLARVEQLRDVLSGGGRSLAQGALAWLLARSDATLPIPGFKSVAQVEDNAAVLATGPLSPAEMEEIDRLLHPG